MNLLDENIVDLFDVVDDLSECVVEDVNTPESALVNMLNTTGIVDMRALEEQTGQAYYHIAEELNGAIFQNPEPFDDEDTEYSPYDYWTVSADYLSGNIRRKLDIAERMNRKYFGCFDRNIEALKRVLPASVQIGEIHINLGASWIPSEEYESFIMEFLHFKESPQVCFSKTLLTAKIIPPAEAQTSVMNTITYGVRAGNSNWSAQQYLTAIQIIEQTINAKTVKVYDYVLKSGYSYGTYEYEPIFNKEKTLEAQEKQRKLEDAFRDWVYSSKERISRFEGYYNDTFVGYSAQVYDGAFLTLPGLNPEVKLYKHQRDAIARILLSGNNTLLAHDVGTGKTYEMLIAAHELKRLGLADKTMIVVPNNVLKATVDAYRYLYPDDNNILAVFPKEFTPVNRNAVLTDIAKNNYTAVFMAYSSFDMVGMSKKYYEDKMASEIKQLKLEAQNTVHKHEKRALESKAEKLSKQLTKYIKTEKESPYLSFEALGIDTLIVDEAHNYKNVGIYSRSDNIVGMSNCGSKKCREMYEKVKNVNRTVFATGTPLTNSLADLYTFQSYLQPKILQFNNMGSFDMWINTFGQRENCIECDVDSNSDNLRMVTRFSSFHNLGELMGMFSLVCDFHHMAENEEGLPILKAPTDICVPKNEAQKRYIENLSERTEAIRAKEVKRTEDNLLKVTTDGRKAALDIRLVEENAVVCSSEHSKVDACAETIMKIHGEHPESAQVVFSDIGTPKAEFNVYDELLHKLVFLGMNRSEIAFVHDATTETARTKLFADMNSGKLKVVIGSTQKLGVGVNVQEKLVALHHLSVPWRPADMVQREGRILRKGNTSEEIFIFRYITEGSFDAYSWQLLESKQKFISSFLAGISGEREASDIADAVLSYAEVKALAIGNPLIKKRVEVANKLERAKISFRSRQKQLVELRAVIESLPEKIERFAELSVIAGNDYTDYIENKESISNDERVAFGEELLSALADNTMRPAERLFDEYQGFSVMLPANMSKDRPFVTIESVNGGRYYVEMPTDKTPLGCNKTIDYLLEHLDERMRNLLSQKENAEKQLRDAISDMNTENPYSIQVDILKEELEKIDKVLAENAKEDKAS